MSRVRMEKIVDDLRGDIKRALVATLDELLPNHGLDADRLFRQFRREVDRKCSSWESVKNGNIEKRCRHCGEKS